MRDGRDPDVVVVGGAAGAAIAHKLAEQGKRVVLLCRKGIRGATDTNQKWLHSGLLYPGGGIAAEAWANRVLDWEIKRRYLVGPEEAYILALNNQTISRRLEKWAKWEKEGRVIPKVQPLGPADRKRLRSLGVKFKDGWITPDCAIDFPALVRDMRRNLAGKLRRNSHFPQLTTAGVVMEGARVVRLLRETHGIAGVMYDWQGQRRSLSCNQCVIATGAWCYELLNEIDVTLPIIRKKCVVVVFKRERLNVDRITVWLDIKKEDGTIADFTLVPFNDETLAAGTDFKVVYQLSECTLEDLEVGRSELDAIKRELTQCLSPYRARQLRETDYSPRACFKTEQYNPAHPDVDVKVYTHDAGIGDRGHGVPGLLVAIPGKASLMFKLAREVSKRVL